MDRPAGEKPAADVRDYLAEERTHLAWIRTGLALMGFGFVVSRFGLFLRELQAGGTLDLSAKSTSVSLWAGTALIVMGVVVDLASTARYLRLIRDLNAGREIVVRPSSLAVSIAVMLAAIGLAIAYYVVFMK